jgi:predicted transglutaminase-like cysteine proteinase
MISFSKVKDINSTVNELPYKSDPERYSSPELWTEIDANGGDCEDFALAKRAALLDEGADRSELHMVLCYTEKGEFHAVLVVDTDEGSFVLDNRYPHPMPKQSLDYTWHSIQKGNKWYTLNQ